MKFIFRRLSWRSSDPIPIPHNNSRRPVSFDAATVKFVRDRGLDHAVERERNLRPVINLKNLLKSEPSKSLPLSVIAERRNSLQIPIRPIEFLRKYPSFFEEFRPGGVAIHPHFKLKGEVLELDAEENLIYQSESYKEEAAARVLKLLMISRAHKIPLSVLDRLNWDLGLPPDFVHSIVPAFPDYFRVVGGGDSNSSSGVEKVGNLELVCWKNEFATSIVEKKGVPVIFSMQFSKGFEIDKKFKKWMDEWQKLRYISPYENATHLGPNTDESDKWATSVLHEMLHLFASKKSEKDNVLLIGEWLGIRSRFKRALLNHPGIFYLSHKIGTYTVVLKEAFKRGSVVEEHSIMSMRNRYLHLMNMVKEKAKPVTAPNSSNRKQKERNVEENDSDSISGSEFEDEEESDDDVFEDGGNEDENTQRRGARNNVSTRRRETTGKMDMNMKGRPVGPGRGRIGRGRMNVSEKKFSPRSSKRNEFQSKGDNPRKFQERSNQSRSRGWASV